MGFFRSRFAVYFFFLLNKKKIFSVVVASAAVLYLMLIESTGKRKFNFKLGARKQGGGERRN